MADIQSLHRDPESIAQRRERRRAAANAVAEHSSARRSGFSARLNLLCSLAGERELTDGRIEDIAALQDHWELGEVRAWLSDDRVPTPSDLQTLTAFLLRSIKGEPSAEQWEAYLLLGSDHVESPLHALTQPSDKTLAELASRTLLALTREYQVPPHAYDAELVHATLIRALKDLNVSSAEESLQPGHLRVLARRLFPEHC